MSLRPTGLVLGMAVFCALLAALDWWLWHVRHVHSMDLLFVQARALLALAPTPPAHVLLTSPPLLVYLTMLVGPVWMATALCGAVAMLILLGILTRPGGRTAWMLVLLAHPVVLFGATAYPARLVACALVAAAVSELVEYVRRPRLNPLTNAAGALAALVLVDWSLWPLWIVLIAGLALALDVPWEERLTLCVVALFPALAVSGTWLYFNATETGSAWYFRDVPELSLDRMELWTSCADPFGCAASRALVVASAVPVFLFGAVVALWSGSEGEPAAESRPRRLRTSAGTTLILAAPLVLLLHRAWQAAPMTPLDATVLAFAAALAIAASARGTAARAASWAFLAVLAVSAWHAVLAGGGEPAALLAAARSGQPTPVTAPAVHMADRIRAAGRDGSAVLLDDRSMFPVVGLLEAGGWIPSSSWEFHLATEHPQPYARYVLQAQDHRLALLRSQLHVTDEVLAASYVVEAREGALWLYRRRADWKTERSRR